MAITILGFASTDKVPGFVGETVYGAGAISLGSIPIKLLCVGGISTDGDLTPDTESIHLLLRQSEFSFPREKL